MSEQETQKELIESIINSLRLSAFGSKAFVMLCQKGCEPETLEHSLFLLFSKGRTTGKGTIRISDGRKAEIRIDKSLRPLDSLDEALGTFDKRQIGALQKNLMDIASKVEALNNTNLFQSIGVDSYDFEALLLPKAIRDYAEKVIPLVQEKLEVVGEKSKPQFSEYLMGLVRHVKASTGNPNYKLICDVLNDFGLDWDEDGLKQWVYRQQGGGKKRGNAK